MGRRDEMLAGVAGVTVEAGHDQRQTRTREADAVDIDLTAAETDAQESRSTAAPARARPSVDDALELARGATAPPRSVLYHASKRLVDVVLASVLLVVMAPVMAVLAALIRLDSKGSPIFVQRRVGENGRIFRFFKFRTMHIDAATRFPELYAYQYDEDEIATMYFKLPYDPRCTRFGKHLRRTSLDELPNLLNVLKGDMSFVGPRPEIPQMLPYYAPHQFCKFAVKPGMTGLAQVSGRNILRFVETNAKDHEYVQRRSLWLDLTILCRTIAIVVLMIGAH